MLIITIIWEILPMFNSAKQTALQALPPQHHVVTVKTGFKRGMLYGIMIGFFVGGLSAYQAARACPELY
jgi:tetrahydromethanopterin S-methyltransferase subunit B